MIRPSLAALAGLMFGSIATLMLWVYADRLSQHDQDEAFTQRISHARLAVDRALDELTGSLQTIRSLFEASGQLDAEDFERAMRLRSQRLFHTGVQFIGLAFAGTPARADCTPAQGQPCLTIGLAYPTATNEVILGADPMTDSARRMAIARAIDTGHISVTEPLPFAADNIAAPGLIAYLPIYRRSVSLASIEARRRALAAIAMVSFSLEDIVRADLGAGFFRVLGFRITDLGLIGVPKSEASENPIVLNGPALIRYHATGRGPSEILAVRLFQRGFAGHEWQYAFELLAPSRADASVATPRLILVLGGLSTILLTTFLQFVSRARVRAETLAGEMTRHLQENESRLRLALDAAQMGAWNWDAGSGFDGDGRAHDLLSLRGLALVDLFADLDASERERAVAAIDQAMAGDGIVSFEGRLKAERGTRHIELVARVARGADGRPLRAVGLVRDISERTEQASARRRLMLRLVTAEEQERRRIARELHDQLGQEITAISFGLKHLQGLDAEPQARADLVTRLREIVQAIDERVDRFMLDLRPVVLDDLGLEAALQAQFEQWAGVHGIEVNSHFLGLRERVLPFEVATTTFRLVQESLTNVARHAGASAVDVIVEADERGCAWSSKTTAKGPWNRLPRAARVWPACVSAWNHWGASFVSKPALVADSRYLPGFLWTMPTGAGRESGH
ncbi:MAG: CHASE domain-containing protein [Burkholderiaceae bacterium]